MLGKWENPMGITPLILLFATRAVTLKAKNHMSTPSGRKSEERSGHGAVANERRVLARQDDDDVHGSARPGRQSQLVDNSLKLALCRRARMTHRRDPWLLALAHIQIQAVQLHYINKCVGGLCPAELHTY